MGASRPTELPFSWGVPILAMLAGILLRAAALAAAGQPLSIASLVQAYCRWDCDHYMSIARQGYGAGINEAGGADWAFFPLVPLATSAIVKLTALSFPSAGTLAALLATFGASRLALPLCPSPRAYVLFCAAVALGPASLYFTIPYSESLFLLGTVMFLRALSRENYLGAGLAGMVLSASRAVGLFAAPAMLLDFVVLQQRNGVPWRQWGSALWRRPDVLLGLVVVPLGIGLFSIWLYFQMGDGLAFSHIQRHYYRDLVNPVTVVWRGLQERGESRIHIIAFFVGAAGVVILVRRGAHAAGMFCALAIITPLLLGPASMYRFVIALAPYWLLISAGLAQRRWLTIVWLVALGVTGFLTDLFWLADVHYLV